MARKLGLGWSIGVLACLLSVGCQTGGSSRPFAHHSTTKGQSPAIAKQGMMPPPGAAGSNQNSGAFRNNLQSGVQPSGFNTAGPFPQQTTAPTNFGPSNPNTFQQAPLTPPPMGPMTPPAGQQGLGAPTTSNRTDMTIYPPPSTMPPLPTIPTPGPGSIPFPPPPQN